MNKLFCLAVLTLVNLGFAAEIKEIANFGNKIFYAVLVYENVSSAEAKTICNMHGYTLAAVETPVENNAVGNYLRLRERSGERLLNGWLGATDGKVEGLWYWLYSRRNIGPFRNWAKKEPVWDDEYNCMYMKPPAKGMGNNAKWYSYFCNEPHGFPICQKMADNSFNRVRFTRWTKPKPF